MKLLLLRHTRTRPPSPGQEDHDRVLTRRGHADAVAIGAWIARRGHLPDRVICSTAARTCETLAGLTLPPVETTYLGDLYLANACRIRALVQAWNAATLLVVAHNPGIAEAASSLATSSDPAFADYPPGSCAVIDVPTRRCLDFFTPD